MCALCGVLGGKGHWSDSANAPQAFAGRSEPQTRASERQARVRILNTVVKHHGLAVKDWSGASYLLAGATGRTAVVETLTELWSAAERIGGKKIDPLDEKYLASLDNRQN
jgi:hypothetical protein